MRRPYKRTGWPTIAGLGLVVVAFMVLSLLVTATGTARFAVAMGYDARTGYAVGAIFDIAKGILPVALLALLALRALGSACLLGDRLDLPGDLQLAGHARDREHRHLLDRAHRHLEDGGTRQHQGGVCPRRAAACHLEPSHAAPAGQDGARGAESGARAIQRVARQPGVRQDPGKRLLRESMRPGRTAA